MGSADGFVLLADAHAYLRAAVRGVPADAWGSATPCDEWTVRQVLNHARLDQQALLIQIAQIGPMSDPFEPEDAVAADPYAELDGILTAAMAAWEAVRDQEVVQTPMGPMPPTAATAAAALDAGLHAWDIARGTGQDLPLSDELADGLGDIANHLIPFVRDSFGKYAAEVPTDAAGPAAALLAFSGRDPLWSPKAS
ncbi:TIGR03086 family metal-binding protein [Yinghuangia seranimata]|uniref:TIGR03086 family metal-binding protein n=1 Tax=Yinghuangia seranimata TaxID=408067 RepID=UPI00248B14C2|nr:TIGR03086 family metal-binding protein [Yinghuangia seranimata]MDI2127258.1 TIGR03086 family metal-binding protein [Yinghuangia seranimata]MDI2132203.1 TIGR03086 family metal-binding protein [Yinghuangia seranimata]